MTKQLSTTGLNLVMPKHGNHWRYHGQYKHFVDAQKYALEIASKLTEDNIIRIVKYTQNIEILETKKCHKDNGK